MVGPLEQNLGIDIAVNVESYVNHYDRVGHMTMQGPYTKTWFLDWPGPQNFLGTPYGENGWDTGYSNPEVGRLIEEGDAASSLPEAIALYQQGEDLILEEMPVIPILHQAESWGHSVRVSNIIREMEGPAPGTSHPRGEPSAW